MFKISFGHVLFGRSHLVNNNTLEKFCWKEITEHLLASTLREENVQISTQFVCVFRDFNYEVVS